MTRVASIRLSEELAVRIDDLATALGRPKTWVIEQALTRYVKREAWQVQAIKAAVDSYNAEAATGHIAGYDFDEVMDELEAEAKLPRGK